MQILRNEIKCSNLTTICPRVIILAFYLRHEKNSVKQYLVAPLLSLNQTGPHNLFKYSGPYTMPIIPDNSSPSLKGLFTVFYKLPDLSLLTGISCNFHVFLLHYLTHMKGLIFIFAVIQSYRNLHKA